MGENDQDKTESKTSVTEEKPGLPSSSPKDQEELDHLRKKQIEDTIKQLRGRGYKITEEYGNTGQLSKVSRERPPRKTWWDWLQLLIIPLFIAGLGIGFTWVQNQTSLQIANNQQQETILQTYLDNMSDLLLNKELNKSKPGEAVSEVARERTLTTLRRLDAKHNKIVLRFLQDAHLIGIQDAVISLSNADLSAIDLSNADLSGADLSAIDLSGADLSGTKLSGAILKGAILKGATMSGATLNGADLSNAFLNGADLSGADLSGASLIGADLRYANLSKAILNGGTLDGAIMKGANLSGANLSGATLIGAILSDANLSGANLSDADLSDANLSGAILSGVRNLTQQQLDEVYPCKNAILSTGLICHRNQ